MAWLWVLLGATALAIIGGGLGAVALITAKPNAGGQGGAAGLPSPQANPGIGQPVVDGKLEFVVRGVECGVEQVGAHFVIERAQGQFCLVTVSVKNIGDQPETLFDRYQVGLGTNGAVYRANSAAGIAANDIDSQVWVTEINPGNEMIGAIVYDLPKDVVLARVELQDSTLSGGVTVDLK